MISNGFKHYFKRKNSLLHGNAVLITGLPRSGTTLVCRLLSDLPDIVALNEPMRISELTDLGKRQQIKYIRDFAKNSRQKLLQEGKALSMQIRGEIPENMFAGNSSKDGMRELQAEMGELKINKQLSAGFTLVLKHNHGFTAMLKHLAKEFECFGIIRNPLAVMASWNTLINPIAQGRAPIAEKFDRKLGKVLTATTNIFDRQIHILNWFFDIYRKNLKTQNIIRYEDIIASRGNCLKVMAPGLKISDNTLISHNINPVYSRDVVTLLAEKLLSGEGAYLVFYSKNEIETLLQESILKPSHHE